MELADELCDKIESKYPEFSRIKFISMLIPGKFCEREVYLPLMQRNVCSICWTMGYFYQFLRAWEFYKLDGGEDFENVGYSKLYLKRLPLWIGNLRFRRFDDKSNSGGEELFLNSKGGGIALLRRLEWYIWKECYSK